MIPYSDYREYSQSDMLLRSQEFLLDVSRRRTVREFSSRPVPPAVIENCIKSALTAPSGANMQPWHFVVVADPLTKAKIREGAEREEHEFYHSRAPKEWLDALAPLGTDESKPYLETAPYLIVIFQQLHGMTADGQKIKHYYASESVGLAAGILITAVHNAGLASLTHTPSPMGFLNTILDRPVNEKPFLILVVGYPEENARVPAISKRAFDESVSWVMGNTTRSESSSSS
jgi:nitroreductase